ncbi:MAG: hypothetical protein AB7S41_13525 [Parvibaculaceae bacterium]
MVESEYWRREGLDRLVATYADPGQNDPYYATSGNAKVAFAPQISDLARLHRLIRERMATTVLEFGVGFSTVVMADALAKNEAEFAALPNAPKLRNRRAFQLVSVDASRHWISETEKRIPAHLRPRIEIGHSRVLAGTHLGQLCHFYETLPNVVADFIYLDGPSPKDVEGSVNGLDFLIDERTVMSADLLLMEPTMLPGTFILVDGRTNNARFLERNFRRPFKCTRNSEADVTTFELDEPPLGRHSHDLVALLKQAGLR